MFLSRAYSSHLFPWASKAQFPWQVHFASVFLWLQALPSCTLHLGLSFSPIAIFSNHPQFAPWALSSSITLTAFISIFSISIWPTIVTSSAFALSQAPPCTSSTSTWPPFLFSIIPAFLFLCSASIAAESLLAFDYLAFLTPPSIASIIINATVFFIVFFAQASLPFIFSFSILFTLTLFLLPIFFFFSISIFTGSPFLFFELFLFSVHSPIIRWSFANIASLLNYFLLFFAIFAHFKACSSVLFEFIANYRSFYLMF